MHSRSVIHCSRYATRVAAALLLACSTAAAAEWPQFRGPGHNGQSPEQINTNWASVPPKVRWTIPLGSSLGSFTTGAGKLFVLEKKGDDELCEALDPANGKSLWSADIGRTIYDKDGGDGPRSTPTFNDGRVYVLGTYKVLACLDASDGKVIWKHDLMKEFDGAKLGWGNAASPLVDGDLVFVCAGGKGQSLIAFNRKTGDVVWKGQDDGPTHATPIIADLLGVRQVIFFTQAGLVSVKPETGDVLWRQKFPYNVSTAASPVACGNDIVYCSAGYGSGSGAYRIARSGDRFTSTELWHKHSKYLVNHWSTPVYKDGYLYGLFGFKEFKTEPLKCIEVKTGRELWSQPGFGQGQVLLVGDDLLVQGDTGDLVLARAASDAYHEIGRCHPFDGKPKCWTDPAVANGRIYARSQTGGVCLDVTAQ